MKNQDIGLLLKLLSLRRQHAAINDWPLDWQDWKHDAEIAPAGFVQEVNRQPWSEDLQQSNGFTVRSLQQQTGISKSQISLSLSRCLDVGLLVIDSETRLPKVNEKALFEFIVYGLKYVFPARPAELARGVATAFAAPVLRNKLTSAGEFSWVWPHAYGNSKGLKVEPLFKSAVLAIKTDPEMYAYLALIDAIRIGQARERNLAIQTLKDLWAL